MIILRTPWKAHITHVDVSFLQKKREKGSRRKLGLAPTTLTLELGHGLGWQLGRPPTNRRCFLQVISLINQMFLQNSRNLCLYQYLDFIFMDQIMDLNQLRNRNKFKFFNFSQIIWSMKYVGQICSWWWKGTNGPTHTNQGQNEHLSQIFFTNIKKIKPPKKNVGSPRDQLSIITHFIGQ